MRAEHVGNGYCAKHAQAAQVGRVKHTFRATGLAAKRILKFFFFKESVYIWLHPHIKPTDNSSTWWSSGWRSADNFGFFAKVKCSTRAPRSQMRFWCSLLPWLTTLYIQDHGQKISTPLLTRISEKLSSIRHPVKFFFVFSLCNPLLFDYSDRQSDRASVVRIRHRLSFIFTHNAPRNSQISWTFQKHKNTFLEQKHFSWTKILFSKTLGIGSKVACRAFLSNKSLSQVKPHSVCQEAALTTNFWQEAAQKYTAFNKQEQWL